ncbi:MAG: hypothetical protein ACQ9MH_24375 [Nitrospinales bacterium]
MAVVLWGLIDPAWTNLTNYDRLSLKGWYTEVQMTGTEPRTFNDFP